MATQESIARGNERFFKDHLPAFLLNEGSIIGNAIWGSMPGPAQCLVPGLEDQYHLLSIFSEGEEKAFYALAENLIREDYERLLCRISEEVHGLKDEATIQMKNWSFAFRIVGYGQRGKYLSRIDRPWEDDSISDEKNLNRFVELRISPCNST